MRDFARALAAPALVLLFLGCGGGKSGGNPDEVDAAGPPVAQCGNGTVDPGEDCDNGENGSDDTCNASCKFTCGDGRKNFDEKCDIGVPAGQKDACPKACDDGMSCTADVLSGEGCYAECTNAPITQPAPSDGCCLTGSNRREDSDCPAVCGNKVVESPDELCDTGISSGPGSCPTACPAQTCKTPHFDNKGTCKASCTYTDITDSVPGDGCCPDPSKWETDTDCGKPVDCGNGHVDTGELCDIGIPSGNGSCPTTCTDTDSCTRDVLSNPNTCQALCSHTRITQPANDDMCCPTPAGNANNDNDCRPVCGNGERETGEQCDDGNRNDTDNCKNDCTLPARPPTALRFTELVLKDPHIFPPMGTICLDITGAVNLIVKNKVEGDDNKDNVVDLSPTAVFRPLAQPPTATTPMELNFATCSFPLNTIMCRPGPDAPLRGTATNMASGTCLDVVPGTARPYNPAVVKTTASCFVSDEHDLTLNLGGVQITLKHARIAGKYVGAPATQLTDGLVRGFVSEADADATMIPDDLPDPVGGKKLGEILRGGHGNCSTNSDKDVDTDGTTPGWWFYLNFKAAKVPWTD